MGSDTKYVNMNPFTVIVSSPGGGSDEILPGQHRTHPWYQQFVGRRLLTEVHGEYTKPSQPTRPSPPPPLTVLTPAKTFKAQREVDRFTETQEAQQDLGSLIDLSIPPSLLPQEQPQEAGLEESQVERPNIPSHVCSFCGFTAKSEPGLKVHVSRRHGEALNDGDNTR